MYDAYHELGGNGTVTMLVDTLKELPRDKFFVMLPLKSVTPHKN